MIMFIIQDTLVISSLFYALYVTVRHFINICREE